MNRCTRCSGLVPEGTTKCPNCRSARAWWAAPLSIAGAGFAAVTLSACYGAPCAGASVILPDGRLRPDLYSCVDFDCRNPLADGGVKENDSDWRYYCIEPGSDAGQGDAGRQDAGTQDAGTQDAGHGDAGTVDAGP